MLYRYYGLPTPDACSLTPGLLSAVYPLPYSLLPLRSSATMRS